MPSALITGANRGIGLYLTRALAAKSYKVYALVRDPSSMPEVENTLAVAYDATSPTAAQSAADVLSSKGVETIDVVLANAGIMKHFGLLKDAPFSEYKDQMLINAVAPLVLFQAFLPFLKPNHSKFIVTSTLFAPNVPEHQPGVGPYKISKNAANFLVRQLHFEHPDQIIFSVSPGWLPTGMGMDAAKTFGAPTTSNTFEEVIPALVNVFETATREQQGGYMIDFDGSRMSF